MRCCCSSLLYSLNSLGLWNCIPAVDLPYRPQLFLLLLTSDENLAVIPRIRSLITRMRWSFTIRSTVITASYFLPLVVSHWLMGASKLRHKLTIRHIWRHPGGPVEACLNVNNCWVVQRQAKKCFSSLIKQLVLCY